MDVQSIDTVLFDFGGTLDALGVHWLTRLHRLYPEVGLGVVARLLLLVGGLVGWQVRHAP